MMWILIIYLIATAVLGFYAASLLKDTGIERKRYFIENIILLVIAIALILLSPAALGKVIIRIVGIASTYYTKKGLSAVYTHYQIKADKKTAKSDAIYDVIAEREGRPLLNSNPTQDM